MPHNSGFTFPVACNCGRKLFTREDPFTLADANFRFYEDAEDDCCRELDHFVFPVFSPFRAAAAAAAAAANVSSRYPSQCSTMARQVSL